MITRAVEGRASDIHIEPMDGEVRVRYRIDGVLKEAVSPPQRLPTAVITRVKIMANLNIAERRLPQDGRILLAVREDDLDFRISTIPSITARMSLCCVFWTSQSTLDSPWLGIRHDIDLAFRDVLDRPHGIVLLTGRPVAAKRSRFIPR